MFAGIPRKFWLALLLTFMVYGAAFAAGIFGLGYIRANWQVLTSARRELAELEKRHQKIVAAAAALERLQSERELISSSLVNPAEPLLFIEKIEALGRRSGVKVELSLASGPAGGSQNYILSANGTFRKVMSFFRNLESLPFLTDFGDVEMRLVESIENHGTPGRPESLVRLVITIRPLVL